MVDYPLDFPVSILGLDLSFWSTSEKMSTPAAASTSQVVTLPYVPELFDPNFLDVLLPPRPAPSADVAIGTTVPRNAFVRALKSVAHHKFTRNGARAFSSTLSSTLDAFQSLSAQMSTAKIASVLSKAWDDDPALTLRIIWNTRSIHDGKGDKELFYRYIRIHSYTSFLFC